MNFFYKNICLFFLIHILFIQNIFAFSAGRENIQYLTIYESENGTLINKDVLDDYIIQIMSINHIPGLSASIVKNNEIIWMNSYGYANFDIGILVTNTTLFELASVSKTITMTALMQLYEEGLFELDDDINNYLSFEVRNPGFPTQAITFRMLLTHISSIRDNWDIMWYFWGEDSPIPLDEYLFNYLNPSGDYYYPDLNYYSNNTPGSLWHYSNIAIMLVGFLVEEISHQSFAQYCEENIFQPLQMNETSWFLAGLDTTHIAMPYHWNGSGYTPYGFFGYSDYPAGQLRTSVDQLSNFLITYIQNGQFNGSEILDSFTVDTILTIQYPSINNTQGLVWFYQSYNSRLLWGHGGGDYGIATRMHFNPLNNTGVIILTNGESHNSLIQIENELFIYAETTTAVAENQDPIIFNRNYLHSNYPDPFQTSTKIEYILQSPTFVKLRIFDLTGQLVRTLVSSKKEAGIYTIIFDGKDNNGNELSQGIYFYNLKTNNFNQTMQMLLIR